MSFRIVYVGLAYVSKKLRCLFVLDGITVISNPQYNVAHTKIIRVHYFDLKDHVNFKIVT